MKMSRVIYRLYHTINSSNEVCLVIKGIIFILNLFYFNYIELNWKIVKIVRHADIILFSIPDEVMARL